MAGSPSSRRLRSVVDAVDIIEMMEEQEDGKRRQRSDDTMAGSLPAFGVTGFSTVAMLLSKQPSSPRPAPIANGHFTPSDVHAHIP